MKIECSLHNATQGVVVVSQSEVEIALRNSELCQKPVHSPDLD